MGDERHIDPEDQFYTDNCDEWEREDGFHELERPEPLSEFDRFVEDGVGEAYLSGEERQGDTFDLSSEEISYLHIGKAHRQLSKGEQVALGRSIQGLLTRFVYEALNTNEVRQHIYEQYLDRRWAKRLGNKAQSLAKLSRHYNSSVKGKNTTIEKKVIDHMDKAVEIESAIAPWVDDWPDELTKDSVFGLFLKADLTPELWMSPAIKAILVEKQATKALFLMEEIRQRREALVRSVLKLVTDLAVANTRNLSGDVTTAGDVQQHGLIVAYRQTLFYNPEKTTYKNKLTKFSSYCYAVVQKEIAHFLAQNTRTVSIPRSTVDRYRVIKYIMDKYEIGDAKKISLLCNKHIVTSKGAIKKREIFTEDEVEKVLQTIDPTTISMNTTYAKEEGGATARPLIEALPGAANTETEVALREEYRSFLKKVRDILPDDEYSALAYYMGFNDGKGKRSIMEAYKLWPGGISRSKFSTLLDAAKSRLRVNRKGFTENFHNIFTILDETSY